MSPEGHYYYQAPQAQPRSSNKRLLILSVIIGFVVVITGGLMLLNSGGAAGIVMARVAARNDALYALANDANSKIVGSDLRKLNSDAVLFIASDGVLLHDSMKRLGIKVIPKEIQQAETFAATTEQLEQARNVGRFDETYIKVFEQKIDSHQALLREAEDKLDNPAAVQRLKAAYDHLETVQKQLSSLR